MCKLVFDGWFFKQHIKDEEEEETVEKLFT